MLSSLGIPDQPSFDTVRLPRDDGSPTFADPTANGTLHWAPLHDNGLGERMRRIAEWVAAARPDVMVVDVSIEVAMLVRLLGVPVVVMAMPGERTDAPHDLVYRAADHIVAPWPRDLYEPEWLRQHATKTSYVGGISRFDGRPRTSTPPAGRPNVVVLDGAGGSTLDMQTVMRCVTMHPQYHWTTLGVTGGPWVEDPWPTLCTADVVISSAGQSSVADIAAAGRSAIIIAAQRPFAEQHATAQALERGGLAVVRHSWPEAQDWPALFERAHSSDRDAWERWETRGAAARAAARIERVAAERSVSATA